MAVIEKFLKEKLDDAIKRETPENRCQKMEMIENIPEECRELKEMIEKQMPKDGAPVDSILKEKLYYLNNIMTESHMLLKKDRLCTPMAIRLGLANDLKERLKKIKKDLQEAAKWSCRSVDPKKIYGIEDKAMITERLLVKEGFKAIGFVGMAGVGKTALCQKAFNNQQVKKHFNPRIWVCLSEQPDVVDYRKEMVMMMLMCLGFEKKIIDKVGDGEGGLKMLILALQRQLNRQRYLIVLDDVWNMDKDFNNFCSSLAQDDKNEDRLTYGLPKRPEGALLITSRSPIIMESMVGEKNFHSLPLADKKSCWKIFEDAVNKDGVALTDDIKKLKNEIEKDCAGLPLIAKMLGQIVCSKANEQKMSHPSQAQEETHKQES
ncbi:hypothetical protein ACS0TY_031196 [Phlomoides rotata]